MIFDMSKLVLLKLSCLERWLVSDPGVLVSQFYTQPTQLRFRFLCRGVWLNSKKSFACPPFMNKNNPSMPELLKKKRARNPVMGYPGTHDFVQRDNENDPRF